MSANSTLSVTALAALNGSSILQCWALLPGFATSSQAGTIGARSLQLGNLSNASYSEIPPHFEAGLHNAPSVQYVVFLSGLAHITLPGSHLGVYVKGGVNGIIFAADVATLSRLGHNTSYPSSEITTALQIPTEGGIVPEHEVLHAGPCAPPLDTRAATTRSADLGSKRGVLEDLD